MRRLARFIRGRTPEPAERSDHFDGRRFHNPNPVSRGPGALWRWYRERERNPWSRITDFARPAPPPARADGLAVTWIGHATTLIQAAGHNVLTDPVFSEHVGPVPGLGPRRYHPPGLAFDDLPAIDTVLISHAHYDHLDRPTIRRLIARFNPLFVAAAGLSDWLVAAGARRIVTLDWWQDTRVGDAMTVTATPARHWSRRGLTDRNRALWVGYWIETAGASSLFFAGDTGFGPHFSEIRHRLGAPAVALLPIGAYAPRWFMAPQHMNPQDAVQAHQELGAGHSLGIHFATFKLSDEGQWAPVAALSRARAAAGLPEANFQAPAFGQRVVFTDD